MKRIKVCGLTRAEDVELCCRLGADFLGFVLAPSPRSVSFEQLETLVKTIPATVSTVAVTVDPSREEVDRYLGVVDRVQFHGGESPDFCKRYGRRAMKAFRVREQADLKRVAEYQDFVGAVFLDSYKKGVAGGTGHTFTWDLLEGHRFTVPAFLAGGLKVGNLKQAWNVAQVSGLDLSSGLESAPGVKDSALVEQFFAQIEQLRGNGFDSSINRLA